jgi:hypothetical protein
VREAYEGTDNHVLQAESIALTSSRESCNLKPTHKHTQRGEEFLVRKGDNFGKTNSMGKLMYIRCHCMGRIARWGSAMEAVALPLKESGALFASGTELVLVCFLF